MGQRLQMVDHQRQVRLPCRDARRQIVLEGARVGDRGRNLRLAPQRLADLPREAGEERSLVVRARLPQVDVEGQVAPCRGQRFGNVAEEVALLAQRRTQQGDAFVGQQVARTACVCASS